MARCGGHDASLDPTWANSPSSKEIGSILEEHGIKLEVGEAPAGASAGASSPLDIPFEKPGDGDTLSWSANPLGQGFRLRGKQYKKDRKKFPSRSPCTTSSTSWRFGATSRSWTLAS